MISVPFLSGEDTRGRPWGWSGDLQKERERRKVGAKGHPGGHCMDSVHYKEASMGGRPAGAMTVTWVKDRVA